MKCPRSRSIRLASPSVGPSSPVAVVRESGPRPTTPEPSHIAAIRPSGWLKVRLKTPADGLDLAAHAPCVVKTEVRGVQVRLELKTERPSRDALEINLKVVEPQRSPLEVRGPSWTGTPSKASGAPSAIGPPKRRVGDADVVACDGRTASYPTLDAEWTGTKTIRLEPPAAAEAYRCVNGPAAILRGCPAFALPVEAETKKLNDGPRFADWGACPRSAWNHALDGSPGRSEGFASLRDGQPAAGTAAFSALATGVDAGAGGSRRDGWGWSGGPPRRLGWIRAGASRPGTRRGSPLTAAPTSGLPGSQP